MRFTSFLQTASMLCVLSGCLPPDPDLYPGNPLDHKAATATAIRQTAAPLRIDPAILASRAFGEAPILSAEVRAGKLPPVSERLPENPRIVLPFEQIGRYGGNIRRAITGDIVQVPAVMKVKNESLLIFSHPLGDSIEPNLAEHCEFLDGGRTAIIKLRKGIRWSNGAPFTADDVMFFYEDMLFDDNARPSDRPAPPSEWMVNGRPIRLEKLDAHTLRFSSPRPMGRLRQNLAGVDEFTVPRHFLSRWHPRYNPDASYAEFRKRATRAQLLLTPGVPTLSAWYADRWMHGQRIVFRRNPYYWKIDTAGNQLPYVDELVFEVIPDQQVILLKFMNGELDLFGRYSQINMFHTLKQEEKRGKFKTYVSGPTSAQAFFLNWDAPRPALRRAFRDRRVRIALSLALNREEISQVLYHGLLVPCGYAYFPPNPYYTEETFRKYSGHDPEQARRLLENAGYRDTDGDGYREFADGSRFEFTLDVVTQRGTTDMAELVTDYWREIGIKINTFGALRDIIMPRRLNGEFDVHYWWFEGPDDPLGQLSEWAITAPNTPFWHRTASQDAPKWLQEATRNFLLAATTTDTAEVRRHMVCARDLCTENIPAIVVGASYRVWGANKRLGNVPDDVSFVEIHGAWGRPLTVEQIFIKSQDNAR